jgi:hypothetical protein
MWVGQAWAEPNMWWVNYCMSNIGQMSGGDKMGRLLPHVWWVQLQSFAGPHVWWTAWQEQAHMCGGSNGRALRLHMCGGPHGGNKPTCVVGPTLEPCGSTCVVDRMAGTSPHVWWVQLYMGSDPACVVGRSWEQAHMCGGYSWARHQAPHVWRVTVFSRSAVCVVALDIRGGQCPDVWWVFNRLLLNMGYRLGLIIRSSWERLKAGNRSATGTDR